MEKGLTPTGTSGRCGAPGKSSTLQLNAPVNTKGCHAFEGHNRDNSHTTTYEGTDGPQ